MSIYDWLWNRDLRWSKRGGPQGLPISKQAMITLQGMEEHWYILVKKGLCRRKACLPFPKAMLSFARQPLLLLHSLLKTYSEKPRNNEVKICS